MIKLGIVMDPISQIHTYKDTSFALLLEAQERNYQIFYMEMNDLFLLNGVAKATTRLLTVVDNNQDWYSFGAEQIIDLADLDVILMRKDPPFNTEFVQATYILERAELMGCLVVNKPQSLRDCNEKLFTAWFPDLTPDTLVTRNADLIKQFYQQHKDIIIKPLDGMGGTSIFRIQANDPNLNVIIETVTELASKYCMVQNYIPAITDGDKRILIIDGEVVPYCLARIPKTGETRGNLAAGGRGEARELTESDFAIANKVAPIVREKGLLLVGLDVIGDKLTEINVTSPTCMREIEAAFPISIRGMLMDAIEKYVAKANSNKRKN